MFSRNYDMNVSKFLDSIEVKYACRRVKAATIFINELIIRKVSVCLRGIHNVCVCVDVVYHSNYVELLQDSI